MTSPSAHIQDPPLPASDTVRRLAYLQTAAYCIGFIAIGLCGGQLGPALSSLAAHTGSTLSVISIVFVISAIGRMIGSLSAGWLLDRGRGHPLMAGGFVLVALAMGLIPQARSMALLLCALLLFGVAINWIDVCTNTLIVRVHGDKVAPYMNALHLTFGIGASLAPLLVGRSFALTGDVVASYSLVAVLILPMALWLWRLPEPVARGSNTAHPETRLPWLHMLLMAAFFYFLVSVETLGAQWTFNLGLSLGLTRESGAPLLASTFWWMYSLGRLIAVPLSLRVKPGLYVAIDLAGVVLFSILLLVVLFTRADMWLVWVSVIGGGLSIASAFPSALSYIGSRMNMSGTITGTLFAASNFGAMTAPWWIGQVFESAGAIMIPATGLVMSSLALCAFVAMTKILRQRSTYGIANPPA
jgi:MFS transporter, FHS family, Na+ dependent glucose transporter 1